MALDFSGDSNDRVGSGETARTQIALDRLQRFFHRTAGYAALLSCVGFFGLLLSLLYGAFWWTIDCFPWIVRSLSVAVVGVCSMLVFDALEKRVKAKQKQFRG